MMVNTRGPNLDTSRHINAFVSIAMYAYIERQANDYSLKQPEVKLVEISRMRCEISVKHLSMTVCILGTARAQHSCPASNTLNTPKSAGQNTHISSVKYVFMV